MSKGVSETFDEHEQDTAQRGYPKQLVERATRTTKMNKVDLERLVRTESGTRPAVSPDDIDRHVRERMEGALSDEPRRATMPIPIPAPAAEDDAHSRPTIEASIFKPVASTDTATTAPPPALAPTASTPPLSRETPAAMVAPVARPNEKASHVSVPRWLFTLLIVGSVALAAAAGALGFVAGRLMPAKQPR